jgi:vesicle coat complex subunit
VRKTAAICIAKLYDVTPELIEEQGFLKLLDSLVNDGNAMVVSNAICAQLQI